MIETIPIDKEVYSNITPAKRLASIPDANTLKKGQREVFAQFCIWFKQNSHKFFTLSGKAGTGKTFLTAFIIEYILAATKKSVIVSAPTHQAVSVLKNNLNFLSSKLEVKTTHSYLKLVEVIDRNGQIRFKPMYQNGKIQSPDPVDILIVDECSMVGKDLLQYIEDSPAKRVIFIGDVNQLRPVKEKTSGTFNISLFTEFLTENIRQGEGSYILDESNRLLEGKNKIDADGESVISLLGLDIEPFNELIYHYYTNQNYKQDTDFCRFLAYKNKRVEEINEHVRTVIYEDPHPDFEIGEMLYTKRPVIEDNITILNNNSKFKVIDYTEKSWDFGQISVEGYESIIEYYDNLGSLKSYMVSLMKKKDLPKFNKFLEDWKNIILKIKPNERSSHWKQWYAVRDTFVDYSYLYATTVHRAQGCTLQNIFLVQSNIMKCWEAPMRKELLYTALTRAKKYVYLC